MKEAPVPFGYPVIVKGVVVKKTDTKSVDIGIGDNIDSNVVDFEYSYDLSGDPRKVVVTEVIKVLDYHWKVTFYNIHTSDIEITVTAILSSKD
ncbi:hypothetical protein [Bacillus cereus]|uniref:hypothetical protein n=1 Tax=Bacillus cereus TaxID=1396 RepID=UPI000BF32B41|nr:hypothetical protein [Bacillus cereus]PES08136.1 hypothetical protein CN494_30475 [Bacillus cereus]